MSCRESIKSIVIADFSGLYDETGYHKIEDVHLRVSAYTVYDALEVSAETAPRSSEHGDEEDAKANGALRIIPLPNASLVGCWENLVFDDEIPGRLLRYATGMSASHTVSTLRAREAD